MCAVYVACDLISCHFLLSHTHKQSVRSSFDTMIKWDYITGAGGGVLSAHSIQGPPLKRDTKHGTLKAGEVSEMYHKLGCGQCCPLPFTVTSSC